MIGLIKGKRVAIVRSAPNNLLMAVPSGSWPNRRTRGLRNPHALWVEMCEGVVGALLDRIVFQDIGWTIEHLQREIPRITIAGVGEGL